MGMVVYTVSLNGEERLNFGKETRYKHVIVIYIYTHIQRYYKQRPITDPLETDVFGQKWD